VHGLQYEVEGAAIEEDDAPDLYFGRNVAPGFFAWLMPAGPGRGRLGLAVDPRATDRPPLYYLERLVASHPAVSPRMRGARIVRKMAGRIPILGPRRPTATDGMIVAGDAAGHVKATSGGGIYFSMLAGETAGLAAAQYVGADARGRRSALAAYERWWQAAFGREIRFTSLVRRTLNRLPDRHLSAAIRALASNDGLRRAVEEHGDTQYQSRILWPALAAAARAGLRDRSLTPAAAAAAGACLLALWSHDGMPPAPEDRADSRSAPSHSNLEHR
jgi:flavin-dependent dehydrogenase